MNDQAFQYRISRVVEQAGAVRGILGRLGQYDEVRIDVAKLEAALDAAETLSETYEAIDIRKSVKAIYLELSDTYTANLGEDGDPDLLQLDPALESLIARLTALADSADPDWAELGPDARGQVVAAADYAEVVTQLRSSHDEIIGRMDALEQQLTAQAAEQDKIDVSVSVGLLSVTRSVSAAKLKELVERMMLSGERLSGNRLGAASDEVRLALDAFEAEIAREERALAVEQGLHREAQSLLAYAKETARQVRAFVRQVFGSSVAGPEPLEDAWPAGKVFRDVDEPWCPEMVVIPGGTFVMGSPEDEPGRRDYERPQHQVTVLRFALGIYAVTFAEYDHFCEATGREKPDDRDWGRADRPVIDVSWKDASAYCEWLSGETGCEYRLPSEAEWEYACRAGTTTPFWWGETITPAQANYDGTFAYNGGETGEYRRQTVPARSFEPNPFGLYQVHGNGLEWVQDDWYDSYEGAPTDGSAWLGGDDGMKVLRGGSWNLDPQGLRSADRGRGSPDLRDNSIGFRVSRTLTP